MLYLQIAAFVLATIWFVLLRPRRGPKDAPPLASNSKIPVIGHLVEFFSGPNDMVKRCLKDYGNVFTIPVSRR